jgi:hypothetical protein
MSMLLGGTEDSRPAGYRLALKARAAPRAGPDAPASGTGEPGWLGRHQPVWNRVAEHLLDLLIEDAALGGIE